MLFFKSYCVLRFARCKNSDVTNFIFRNISRNSKLTRNVDELKDNEANKIRKECYLPKHVTSNDKDYIPATNNGDNKNSVSVDFVDTNAYKLDDALQEINIKIPGPLDPCDEDISHIGPHVTPTYNFAKYADQSVTIQKLVKLGVKLYKFERYPDIMEMFLSLDFDKHIKPYIQFLHDCGVKPENLGQFITRNPMIFQEDMDDLYTRIRYLRAHDFTSSMIQRILILHPPWLCFKTSFIDKRLGYFQNTFKLIGSKVKSLAIKCPKLITYDMRKIECTTFSIKQEMGFNFDERQMILLRAPRVWIRARSEVVKSFDYLHNQMEISHSMISLQPEALTCRQFRLKCRHEFLVHLQRNQYDPSKPMYVSLMNLISGSDVEFCKNIAKASIDTYNLFLKNY